MELYPLMFEHIYKEKVWGGRRLEQLGRQLPDGEPIGESWDVVDSSRVRNGALVGQTLSELVPHMKQALVGDRVWEQNGDQFPLLLKLIDATDILSVQVHPDDEYAQHQGEPRGKSECWYVLHAEPGGQLIHGFNQPVDRATLEQALQNDALTSYLYRVPVEAGDVLFVPAGTVHAIDQGLLLYEVQQRSDTTYRLHDWGRAGLDGKPRPLHIERSLDVVDFSIWPEHISVPLPIPLEDGRFYLAACCYFALESWIISGITRFETDGESFNLMTVVEGTLGLRYGEDGDENLEVGYGETVLLPAELGLCLLTASSRCKVLRAYVPDLWMDVVSPLLNAGVSREDIIRLGGYGRQNDLAPLLVWS